MVVATIVGAGPAGSIAAEILARRGVETRLIDQDAAPGEKKPCGGMLRISGASSFGIPWRLASRQIRGLRVVLPNHKIQEVAYSQVVALNLNRGVLGSYLLERVRKFAGKVFTGTKVVDVTRCLSGGKTTGYELACRAANGEISRLKTDLLIAADGTNSVVVRKTGIHRPFAPNQLGLCVQYQIQLGSSTIERRIGDRNEMYYGHDVAPFGYAWIFPKRDSVTVGVGSLLSMVSTSLKKYLDYFVNRHPVARKKLDGGKIMGFETATCPLSGLIKPTYDDNLLVAGDAAGHCSPISGEGIYYSMVAGRIAGETSLVALNRDDLSARSLKNYEKAWRRSFGSDLRTGRWLQRISNRRGFMGGTFEKETLFSRRLGKRVADILTGMRPYAISLVKAIPEFSMARAMGWVKR